MPDQQVTVGAMLDVWLADVLPGTVAKVTEGQYQDVVRLYIKPQRVLARYVLEFTFDTGETRVVDVESWLTGPMFEPLLADYAMFKAVRVDADAGTIVWPNGADFSPSGLYVASKPVVPA